MNKNTENTLASAKKKKFFSKENSLCEFVVPFVESSYEDSEEGLKKLYLKFLKFQFDCPDDLLKQEYSNIFSYMLNLESLIIKMKTLYRRMLEVAFSDDEISELEDKQLVSEIEYTLPKPKFHWRGKDHIGYDKFMPITIPPIISSNGHLYQFDMFDLEAAKRLFGLVTEELMHAFQGPDAYKYFGKCPHCGHFFCKKRSSQIYCSDRCSDIVKQRNYRNKKAEEKSINNFVTSK